MSRASHGFLSGLFLRGRLRRVATPAACCLAVALGAVTTTAETPLSRDFLGSGMHAFHAGSYQESIQDLTAAINAGSQDPRAYYFRALALLQQGQEEEAIANMQEGALLESGGPGGIVVGRSLERVQGKHRLLLEQYRRRALIEQQARDQRRIEQRYTEMIESEPERLRERRPEAFLPPASTGSPVAPAAAATTPAATTPPAANDDPFGAPSTPAGRGPSNAGGDDPFGTPSDDPFGGNSPSPSPAGDDPFGSDPFGSDAGSGGNADAGDDPFATPPQAPAARPSTPAPAEGDGLFDDPFGENAAGVNRPRGSGTAGSQVDEQVESVAAETDDTFDQRDEQEEMQSAELDDTLDQRDQQQERDAAAGEGGTLVEPVFE